MIKQQKHPVETFIGRMTGHWLVGNLLLAISYFLTASIGLSLATVPGYATIVWPASGIALGWILLFGWRLLAGVVLGSFIVNVMNAANHAHIGLLEVGRTVPLLIAMGAALQAWVGSQLIRRYVPNLSAFEAPRTVIRTLVLGGFIATLISATWGVSTLYFFGIVNGDLWLKNWLTWWLGDSIGIWVFTPLMLVWGLPDAFYDRTRAFIVMIVSCGAFVLASLSFLLATALEKSERAGNFEVSGQRVVSQMQQRFGEYDEFSVMVRRFFDSSELVTRNEFQRFVSEWLQQHPEVQAVEWAARLSHQHRQAWQQQMSLEFGHSILVAEKNPQSDALVSPAAERTEYLPLTYVVPLAQNKAVLGLDVFTHAGSKELLLRAVTHGKPVLSSPFKLIQANQQAPASFLYTPVYNLPISSQPTWSDIKGFIVVVLKNDQVLAALANKIVPRGQTLMVTDQSTGLVLYGEQADSSVMAVSHQMGLEYFSTIRVGQQIWQIALWPEAQQIEAYSSWLTWMVLVIGLIGTSIAVSYTLISTGHYQYLEREITTQTQIFRQQN